MLANAKNVKDWYVNEQQRRRRWRRQQRPKHLRVIKFKSNRSSKQSHLITLKQSILLMMRIKQTIYFGEFFLSTQFADLISSVVSDRFTPPPGPSESAAPATSNSTAKSLMPPTPSEQLPAKLQQMATMNEPIRKSTKAKWWFSQHCSFLFSLSFSLRVFTSNLFLLVSSDCTVQLTGLSYVCFPIVCVSTTWSQICSACIYSFISYFSQSFIKQRKRKRRTSCLMISHENNLTEVRPQSPSRDKSTPTFRPVHWRVHIDLVQLKILILID